MADGMPMDVQAIMRQIPHRYPMLLVDRVLEMTPGDSIVAVKNVTATEPFFPGHFPHFMVMPGVMIVEALAQATGLLAFATAGETPSEDTLYYFVGIDKARFKRPVVPGDQLVLKAKLLTFRRNLWRFDTSAEVDGRVAATAQIMCAPGKIQS